MKKPSPKVYTITPGKDFLHVLAQAILDGFPLKHDEKHPPLSKWTILVPTRRAARELSLILAERYGRSALLMPSIKPIGDLEELYDIENRGHLPPALSPTAQIFMLLDLLEEWANANPHIELAQEITASPHQRFNLAVSLQQLINQVETEETQFDRLSDAYNEDLSEHRNTILSLLSLVKEALPRKLIEENKLGHAERRSRMIRLEAQRVADGFWKGPIIAAGSTGTIPATRALLKAIALHPQGAVILPGLDQIADDYYWENIEPDHPQFSLKTLVETLGVLRSEIPTLGPSTSDRHWLTSELMRPSATAEKWQETLLNKQTNILAATDGLTCLEAPHRHQEARSIAIILREALEIPGQTAALITPDRDLAKRVKTELQRWNILIDDSAGEPLAQFGVADLTMRILNGVKENFSTASLLNILLHHDCDFGLGREPYLKLLKWPCFVVMAATPAFTALKRHSPGHFNLIKVKSGFIHLSHA
jgi:ATP-dependent helicase/nuclease subunit B